MRPPHFWSAGLDPYSREAAPLTRAFLTPFSKLYAHMTARRIRRANPYDCALPVICIGNVTSGGSGKTPITKALRDLLGEHCIKAAALSRGHGGNLKGPVTVDPSLHTAEDVGDEPLMLAASGETWVSRDRPAGARAIEAGDAALILMDDGHQNPSLHKDISLVVIDAGAPFGNGYVIPKGPLREPVKPSLLRADGIILMGKGTPPSAFEEMTDLPIFQAELRRIAPLPAGPLIAFAGIGRPERFFDSLKDDGADLRDEMSFADHHRYSASELRNLKARAAEIDATLVTTTKDFVRIPIKLRDGIIPIPVEAVFSDRERMTEFLKARLAKTWP